MPESIHYLTGPDHWGYFACRLPIVPRDGGGHGGQPGGNARFPGMPTTGTGVSMVTGLAPGAPLQPQVGMTFHAHSWYTGAGIPDDSISNTVLPTGAGAEVLTSGTPGTLIVK